MEEGQMSTGQLYKRIEDLVKILENTNNAAEYANAAQEYNSIILHAVRSPLDEYRLFYPATYEKFKSGE